MPYKDAKFCHIKVHETKEFKRVKITKGPNKGKVRQFYTANATEKRFRPLYNGEKYKKFFENKKFKAKITYGNLKKTGELAIQRILIPNQFCEPICDPMGECFAPEYKKPKKSKK